MTPTATDPLVQRLCSRVAVLRGLDPATVRATPLSDGAGWPRFVVEVKDRDVSLVVRLPNAPVGAETPAPSHAAGAGASYVDEADTLAQVAPLGLAPMTLQLEPADGLWVYPLWSGTPVSTEPLRDPERLARIGRAFRLLHISGLTLRGQHDPFDGMDTDALWTRDTALDLPPDSLNAVAEAAARSRDALQRGPAAPAPCLNAPGPEACFDTGTRVMFVDWLGAAMGDPHIELARLIERAGLGPEQVAALLDAYFGAGAGGSARDRVTVAQLPAAYRRLLDLRRAVADAPAETETETADPRQRLRHQVEACQAMIDSPAWTEAMERLNAKRPRTARRS
ncbi:phosphotransferase [uncultured Rhodospira sp.]|uniref:phosphotransferase n=1 Tax=uncultured Rhodospira sp. TaxID=1936189 RepID=UPI0026091994|nr:phosphotransferase [uncultured Rhodospira sp.]